jgi:hypothetical protein
LFAIGIKLRITVIIPLGGEGEEGHSFDCIKAMGRDM